MSLWELIEKSGISPVSVRGDTRVLISGIENDSRKVTPGDLFICCVGYKTDGHLYISEAIERGAVAVVASEEVNLDGAVVSSVVLEETNSILALLSATFYHNPSKNLSVIGVTGTNGKSTTTHLVKGIFEAMGIKIGMLGSIAYCIYGNHNLEATNTTPNAVMTQKLMAKMVHNGTKAMVMEVSSIGLAIDRCKEIDFDVAVFMNLTRDHQDFHKTEEEYRNCKAKLFRRMVDLKKHRKIVNIDDPNASFFIAEGNPDVPVVTFGMENKEADVYPLKVELSLLKTWVAVKTPKGVLEISSGLIGRFNVYNILAAVSVGIAVGIPVEDIVKGIKDVDGVPGRFELINEGQNFAVVVDYAHSPDSFSRLLDAARELGARRIITGMVLLILSTYFLYVLCVLFISSYAFCQLHQTYMSVWLMCWRGWLVVPYSCILRLNFVGMRETYNCSGECL